MRPRLSYNKKHKEIVADMKSDDTKQSKVDHDKKVDHMAKAVSKTNRTVYAAERKKDGDGMYITAAVGGRAVLSLLRAKNDDHLNAVYKEIEARKIEHSEPLDNMNWYLRLSLLKEHELGEIAKRPGGAVVGGKAMTLKDITDIVPRSAELKALMPELIEAQAAKRNKR